MKYRKHRKSGVNPPAFAKKMFVFAQKTALDLK
jgi:hypothetical protein